MRYTKPVNVRLETDAHKQLMLYAKTHGVDVTSIIRSLIGSFVKKTRNPKKKQ